MRPVIPMNDNLSLCIHWIFVINGQSKKYARNRKGGRIQREIPKTSFNFI